MVCEHARVHAACEGDVLNGGSLDPLPPLVGKSPEERWVNIPEDGWDEEQMADWVRQSAALPGWEGF